MIWNDHLCKRIFSPKNDVTAMLPFFSKS